MEQVPRLSLVCPVLNEERCLREFHRRARAAVDSIQPPMRPEILYIDDGSSDSSPEILRELSANDRSTRVIEFSRNFGHQFAITAGIDEAGGDAVVVIDTDLQDPPEVIPELVKAWREGYEVVYGVRSARAGESRFKLITARAFYRVLNKLSDVEMPPDSGDFRLLDRRVVESLRTLRERNRYVRGLVAWAGFRQTSLHYSRDGRYSGSTKYDLRKMVRLAMDAVTSFSEKPLRIALQLGVLATVGAVLLAAWIVVGKIITPANALPGFASLMAAVLLLGGLQLLCLGLLGEYVARTYLESKKRPLYIVRQRFGEAASLPAQFAQGSDEVWVEPPTSEPRSSALRR